MLLIQNAYIKSITGPDIPGGCLLADGGRIAAIAPHIDPPEGCTVIDAGGRLLTPGCVEAHCHIGLDNECLRWEGMDYNEVVEPLTPQLRAIDSILENPRRPFCAVLGGSKVSTKISLIEKLMEKVDSIVLGGGMTYTFEAALGGRIGNSICEPEMFPVALEILRKAKQKGVRIVTSPDALIADAFSADARTSTAPSNDIPDGWEGVDIGEEGKRVFREHILGCKTILWNGPVGVFEIDKFATGSRAVAEAIAEATDKGAYSLIGGGDSVACINKFGLADRVSYVSTGGGALLEYMEGKELPGVAAIRKP